jgi:hypothetical protein
MHCLVTGCVSRPRDGHYCRVASRDILSFQSQIARMFHKAKSILRHNIITLMSFGRNIADYRCCEKFPGVAHVHLRDKRRGGLYDGTSHRKLVCIKCGSESKIFQCSELKPVSNSTVTLVCVLLVVMPPSRGAFLCYFKSCLD